MNFSPISMLELHFKSMISFDIIPAVFLLFVLDLESDSGIIYNENMWQIKI